MARKSRLDVIKEKLGGKWKYDHIHRWWNCTDGRQVTREVVCNCWVWGKDCNCQPVFMLLDKSGKHQVDLDHPKIYDLNGKNSKKKEHRKKR